MSEINRDLIAHKTVTIIRFMNSLNMPEPFTVPRTVNGRNPAGTWLNSTRRVHFSAAKEAANVLRQTASITRDYYLRYSDD